MPTLLSENDVVIENSDMLRRVPLPRELKYDKELSGSVIVNRPRSKGLHLSGLIRYIAQASKIGDYRQQANELNEFKMAWAMGHAWEEFAASLYPAMIWQPHEADDPVFMNCDGLSIIEKEFTFEEFKFNRAKRFSGADLIKRKWAWMQQGLGHCLGYEVRRGRWHVLHAFQFPDPVYTIYDIRFSDQECEQFARIIETNKQDAIDAGYAE